MKSLSPLIFYCPVDPLYDFDKEVESGNGRTYGYTFFKEPLCSGCLISKTMLEVVSNLDEKGSKFYICKKGTKDVRYGNVRDYLFLKKLPSYITIADPGTWSYVHKLKLPEFLYDQESLFNYYNSLRFDLCGSVDWPVIDKVRVKDESGKVHFRELSIKEKEYRCNLSVDLAKSFMEKCLSKRKVNFIPFGTVQGYSVSTYVGHLRKILRLGYKYVAIGGLPSYSEKKVLELLPHIRKCIKRHKEWKNIGMHLYGRFPSPSAVLTFAKSGVTSFDNNYPYITASRTNCTVFNPDFTIKDGTSSINLPCYNIKIPSVRSKLISSFKRKSINEKEVEMVIRRSDKCYKTFVRFNRDQSLSNITKFMNYYKRMYSSFRKYGAVVISDNKMNKIFSTAERTLKDKVWEKCGCTACKRAGAHVVLTRGHPRIPFAFFHNCFVQYSRLLKELEKPIVKKYVEKYDWSDVYAKKQLNIDKMEDDS